MKKITLFLVGTLLFSGLGFSQSQRMVLAEECTSSTCWPCGQQNPGFDALLKANADIVTSIKYHVWWPAPGNDPMYLHNIEDNTARTNYYSVNSVPRAIINGNSYNGQPASVSQSLLENEADIPAPFSIQIQHELSPEEDVIHVTTLIEATDDASGELVAHTAVIEKHIEFASPPGTNGEKDFYNVMKKMLPNSAGAELPSEWQAGEYVILQHSWVLENVYDNDELAAVGFVQDKITKDVHQAANSGTEALTPVYASDAELLNILNVTSANCSGTISPVVEIRNNGSSELTSAVIEYSLNEGEVQTYNWSGSLDFLETEEIEFDAITFELLDENTFEANIVSINDGSDDYPANNLYVMAISRAANVTGNAGLWLLLDEFPEETTWEIRNSNGEVVQSGGPYETSGQQYVPLDISSSDCYEFTIYDAGGNGLDYYALVYGNQEIAFEGGEFGSMEKNEFGYDLVGIEEPAAFSDLQIFPNPATNLLNVGFYLSEPAAVALAVVDLAGKEIYRDEIGMESYGPKEYTINTSDLPAGMYFIRVEAGNDVQVHKISIR